MDRLPMHPNVTDLTDKQRQAIELLTSGMNPCNIANALGIQRQTLWRWRQNPEFQRVYRELQQARHEELRDRLHEVLRLSLVSIARGLAPADDLKRGNPLDRAFQTLRILRPSLWEEASDTRKLPDGL